MDLIYYTCERLISNPFLQNSHNAKQCTFWVMAAITCGLHYSANHLKSKTVQLKSNKQVAAVFEK